ncbi:hypothetical protein HAX54_011314 [Datura stramonium]|uniref:ACT domain-containing protein ACR n=1 Tax=Datura stramonium TaxID=4076 RepID=A0ABS8TJG4_DATST|nr:hypothetical protein [Datura stramonium]
MSEISAVLAELGCHVSGAVAWTHNNRAACIVYLEDGLLGQSWTPIGWPKYRPNWRMLLRPTIMKGSDGVEDDVVRRQKKGRCTRTEVKIENCKEKGYSIVTGLRLDVTTQNRVGLLSDITSVWEKQLSISRAEVGVQGEQAVGTFYVKDASGQAVNPETLETVEEIRHCLVEDKSSGRPSSQPSTLSNTNA